MFNTPAKFVCSVAIMPSDDDDDGDDFAIAMHFLNKASASVYRPAYNNNNNMITII